MEMDAGVPSLPGIDYLKIESEGRTGIVQSGDENVMVHGTFPGGLVFPFPAPLHDEGSQTQQGGDPVAQGRLDLLAATAEVFGAVFSGTAVEIGTVEGSQIFFSEHLVEPEDEIAAIDPVYPPAFAAGVGPGGTPFEIPVHKITHFDRLSGSDEGVVNGGIPGSGVAELQQVQHARWSTAVDGIGVIALIGRDSAILCLRRESGED